MLIASWMALVQAEEVAVAVVAVMAQVDGIQMNMLLRNIASHRRPP
jgi:hypothetical protein